MTNSHRGSTRVIKPDAEAKRRCMRCGDIKPTTMFKPRRMVCNDCKEVGKQNFLKAQARRNDKDLVDKQHNKYWDARRDDG